MRTVGEILSEKRKALGLSLEEIEKETKIRRKYLEAIEKNNFGVIAESTIVKGFIRNYAQALGLEVGSTLAVFRRDFCENQKGQIIPRGMVESLVEKTFFWTPKATIVFGLSLLILGFVFFFVRQYVGFSSAPPLEVTLPKDDQLFKEKVVVAGKTDKDASVKIDGTLISIAEDGSFREEVILPRGENMVVIETANRQGKKRMVSRRVKIE
jgi:cytoskeletal protein RodZ